MSGIRVVIDADLEDLIPRFLQNRHQDLDTLSTALEQGDNDQIGKIGHRLKGAAGSYGFADLSDMGVELQLQAQRNDLKRAALVVERIADYMARVEIVYQ